MLASQYKGGLCIMQSQSICSDLLGVTYANSNIPSA